MGLRNEKVEQNKCLANYLQDEKTKLSKYQRANT